MGHAAQAAYAWGSRHGIHLPQRRTLLLAALALGMMLAAAWAVLQVDARQRAPRAVPDSVPPGMAAASLPTLKPIVVPMGPPPMVITVDEPIVIRGHRPRKTAAEPR